MSDPNSSIPSDEAQDPTTIGPYSIRGRIGKGGMGVVYLAEQSEPVRRTVALKVVKAGMDTQEVIARFRAERQALAVMNHPNIARILDSGSTDEGRPYFVMEYVAGTPIVEYCDRNRLSIDDRLRLFVDVCEAVQHAHAKAIIHRDIKPNNILVVDEAGQRTPKVIDFGIAKSLGSRLTDETIHTQIGQFIGTPHYMSPEQAEPTGSEVDARTDVYSLGAVLYELLTGAPPFEFEANDGLLEIQRRLREKEPSKPSTRVSESAATASELAERRRTDHSKLSRALRKDLDWVTMRALETNRARRYQTAAALADDLRKHLAGEPVAAGPPTASYRMGKFVRRNRMGFAAIAIAVLGMAIGVIGVITQRSGPEAPSSNALAEEERTVMILPMEMRGQEEKASYVGRAFSEAVAIRLSRFPQLRVLPVANIEDRLSEGGPVEAVALERGAGKVLTGSVVRDGENIVASLSLSATRQSQLLWGQESTGTDLGELADGLADGIAAELGLIRAMEYDDIERSGRVANQEMASSTILAEVISAFRQQDKDATVETTARLVTAFPGDHDAVVLRSRALIRAGWNYEEGSPERVAAENSIGAIEQADPNSPWGKLHRGMLMIQDGKDSEAIDLCDQLLTRSDLGTLAQAEIHDLRSLCKRNLGDMDGAVADMEEAVRLDPMDARGLAGLGEVLRQAGRVEEGLERGRQSVALNPNSAVSRAMLAWQLLRHDKEDEAIAQSRRALELDPEDIQNNWVYGRILYQYDYYEEAVAPFEKSYELSGAQPLRALQAVALYRSGRTEEASEIAAHAATLSTESFAGARFLAGYYAVAGDIDEALLYMRRILAVAQGFVPDYPEELMTDKDFANLLGNSEFEEILDEIRKRITES